MKAMGKNGWNKMLAAVVMGAMCVGVWAEEADASSESAKKTTKMTTYMTYESTLYRQMVADLQNKGYKLVWQVRNDLPSPAKKFASWETEVMDATRRLNEANEVRPGAVDETVALVCKPSHTVVVTIQALAAGITDSTTDEACPMLHQHTVKKTTDQDGKDASSGASATSSSAENNGTGS